MKMKTNFYNLDIFGKNEKGESAVISVVIMIPFMLGIIGMFVYGTSLFVGAVPQDKDKGNETSEVKYW